MVGEAIFYRIIKKQNKRKEIKILDNCKYVSFTFTLYLVIVQNIVMVI